MTLIYLSDLYKKNYLASNHKNQLTYAISIKINTLPRLKEILFIHGNLKIIEAIIGNIPQKKGLQHWYLPQPQILTLYIL